MPHSHSSTSSRQATPASPSVLPGSAKARKMTATSGRTSAALLHSKDPLGAFSKMFMATSLWASTRCYLTWKPQATPAGRLLFRLAVSMPRTAETASGSSPDMWATPNTMDHLPQRSAEALRRQANTTRKGRKRPANLREQVDPQTVKMWATPTAVDSQGTTGGAQGKSLRTDTRLWPTPTTQSNVQVAGQYGRKEGTTLAGAVSMWPTPRASSGMNDSTASAIRQVEKKGYKHKLEQAVALWPTPTSRDHKGGYLGGRIRNGKVSMDTLDVAVQHTDNQSRRNGQLNPTWVEWLMGYPTAWTALEHSATP